MAVKRGDRVKSRRSGKIRTVAGFTTKPDDVRRARLIDTDGNETKVRVDQISRSYTVA